VAHLRKAAYAGSFRQVFGADVLEDNTRAYRALLLALEVFQQDPHEFYPYSSKFDAVIRGQAQLTVQEARGLAAFNDSQRGNCAVCHISGRRGGAYPQFTDYGFIALGLPRNPAIPVNRDPVYFDLGLCGPLRKDLAQHREYCGLFKTPSLRNAARRKVFFHNGSASTLRDAVRFYAERDVAPERWYPKGKDGGIAVFNDLPADAVANVNREAPFGKNAKGGARLSAQDIDDITVFLGTLNDGYQPAKAP
jgi:cytochrome c peroxidase